MSLDFCPVCSAAVVTDRCPHCQASVPRTPPAPANHVGTALLMIGTLVVVLAAASHWSLAARTGPRPVGLYFAATGAAVAALWFIGRTFGARS
jgi:hypothetical protein